MREISCINVIVSRAKSTAPLPVSFLFGRRLLEVVFHIELVPLEFILPRRDHDESHRHRIPEVESEVGEVEDAHGSCGGVIYISGVEGDEGDDTASYGEAVDGGRGSIGARSTRSGEAIVFFANFGRELGEFPLHPRFAMDRASPPRTY